MRHSIWRDGLVAGAIGATAVALWFLVVDLMHGQPLYTPEALGRGVAGAFGRVENDSALVVIIGYTILHYAAFIGVGLLAGVIVHWGEKQPGVLAGAFILFIALQAGFYALTTVLAQSPVFGVLAWQQVAAGNLVAALAMGTYLWKVHPALRHNLDLALGGRDV